MKKIWVLTVKTSLPNVCEYVGDIKTECFAFERFDDAKQSLKKKLNELAFSENSMFDGNGNMIYFEKYVDNAWDPDEDEEVYGDFLTNAMLTKIYNAVMGIFAGEICDISQFEECYYMDGMIAVKINDGVMTIHGEEDGPFNGYDPQISTNMFDMSEEKDYFLYVDDLFGQDDATSELYIDLKNVNVE